MKHLRISGTDLEHDLTEFWENNQGLENLSITIRDSKDMRDCKTAVIEKNWKAIGALANLRSFESDFLDLPYMQLPFDSLEELRILRPSFMRGSRKYSCHLLQKMGSQLRVLSMLDIKFQDEYKLFEAILRFAPSLEYLAFTAEPLLWYDAISSALPGLSKLKTLKYDIFGFDTVLETFRAHPTLTDIHLQRYHEDNERDIPTFKRDLAALRKETKRPLQLRIGNVARIMI